MAQNDRELGRLSAARSDPDQIADVDWTDDAVEMGLANTVQTPEDERLGDALARGLGGMRTARPGFQDQLEARLLAQLAEPPRPWWRRLGPARRQGRRAAPGVARLPRRSMLGLAAAAALALSAASLSLPLIGTTEVSAREILEKVQANSENPVLAGVKSFHLTAKVWTNGGPKAAAGVPHELTTEQWFVAPDRMRTESRSKDASGKPVLSGFVMNGDDAKEYATEGANETFMIGIFTAPIKARMIGEAKPVVGGAATAKPGGVTAGVRVERTEKTDGSKTSVAYVVKEPDGDGKPGDPKDGGQAKQAEDVVFVAQDCPEPTRTGEATVAGRATFVIQNDFSACLPADAPDDLRGRHVRWVDQKTYLPLKMETYDIKGTLVDRYEVTSIEYDVAIPDKVFTELPAGTAQREAFRMVTGGKHMAPAAKPPAP